MLKKRFQSRPWIITRYIEQAWGDRELLAETKIPKPEWAEEEKDEEGKEEGEI